MQLSKANDPKAIRMHRVKRRSGGYSLISLSVSLPFFIAIRVVAKAELTWQPDNASGVHKYTTDPSGSTVKVTEYDDPSTNAMAILSSQLLNYRARSSAILDSGSSSSSTSQGAGHALNGNGNGNSSANTNTSIDVDPTEPLPSLTRVYATGGASANRTIVSLMADILDAPVSKNVEYDVDTGKWIDAHWNACSVGVAYKARWGYERYLASKTLSSSSGASSASHSQQAAVAGVNGVEVNGNNNVHGKGVGEGDGREEMNQRAWIDFDTLVQECRTRRAALGKRLGRGNQMPDGTVLEEEGIRNVAVPGQGKGAWEGRVGWWADLEARALRGE